MDFNYDEVTIDGKWIKGRIHPIYLATIVGYHDKMMGDDHHFSVKFEISPQVNIVVTLITNKKMYFLDMNGAEDDIGSDETKYLIDKTLKMMEAIYDYKLPTIVAADKNLEKDGSYSEI